MQNIKEISNIIKSLVSDIESVTFFKELLTESEIDALSKRWRILQLLAQGKTQREVAKNLQVSLCNVTRGAKILKDKDSIIAKYLIKEIKNEIDK